MKIHLDELEMAREYSRGHAFEDLSSEQTRLILDRGRELYKWFKAHPRTHALINALVIACVLGYGLGRPAADAALDSAVERTPGNGIAGGDGSISRRSPQLAPLLAGHLYLARGRRAQAYLPWEMDG